MNLNDRIVFARETAGLKQYELADLLSLTRQAVQSWESGNSSPRIQKMEKIAKVLNVSAAWLSTGSGDFRENTQSPKKDKKITDEIILILDLLDGDEKEDALKILHAMAEKRKILNKYGMNS